MHHRVTSLCLLVAARQGAWILAGLLVVLATQPAWASSLRRTAIVKAVEEASPSVVNIHGRKVVSPDHFSADSPRQVNGMGTGIVIDPRGYIITNFHVVDGVERIHVTLSDKRTVIGRLISHDPKTDLAIIKIDAGELPVIRIGTSSDLMCGESVIALGNAYGYEHTVTRGIISALNRTVQVSDDQHYHNLIQTDASINPGNSGGPLLNIHGEMIAINVAVRVGAQGIGFAIPIDEAIEVAARLLDVERIDGVTHGIRGTTIRDGAETYFQVTSVQEGSAAKTGGLQSGDIITHVDQTEIRRSLDFQRAVLGRDLEELELSVRRDNGSIQMPLVLQRTTNRPVAELAWQLLGVRVASVPLNNFRQLNSRYRGGMRITSVRQDSPAARQGIRSGDVLVGIHKWETVSYNDLAYILESSEIRQQQPVKFYILRGRDTLYGHLRLTQHDR